MRNKMLLAFLAAAALTSAGCGGSYGYRRTSPVIQRHYSPTPRGTFSNPTSTYHPRTPRYAPSPHGSPRRDSSFNPHSSKYTPQDRRKMESYQKSREFEARKRAAQEYFRRKGHRVTPKTTHRR